MERLFTFLIAGGAIYFFVRPYMKQLTAGGNAVGEFRKKTGVEIVVKSLWMGLERTFS
jgi:hypothetical protein